MMEALVCHPLGKLDRIFFRQMPDQSMLTRAPPPEI